MTTGREGVDVPDSGSSKYGASGMASSSTVNTQTSLGTDSTPSTTCVTLILCSP
ncbi:hypothetical protein D3C84_992050 [compost metagenome]